MRYYSNLTQAGLLRGRRGVLHQTSQFKWKRSRKAQIMARAIQLGDDPAIEELPEAEEVEVIEEEVAAVSADIDPTYDEEDTVSGVGLPASGIYTNDSDEEYLTTAIFAPIGASQKKEPEKTYLQLPTGKRVIILD